MLKCHIVRSLLPSYVDGVLDDESARDVAAHLEGCAACTTVYEEMKGPAVAETAAPEPPREIKYLRKVRRRTLAITSAVVLLLLLAVAGLYRFYVRGSLAAQADLDVKVSTEGEMWLVDMAHEGERDLIVRAESVYETGADGVERVTGLVLRPYAVYHNPLDDVGNTFQYGYHLTEDDPDFEITLQYADGDMVYDMRDISELRDASEQLQ